MMQPIFGLRPGRLALLFLILLIICAIAAFTFEDRLVKAIVNHLGGLSILGLFAILAGLIARKKGRNDRKAFWLGISLPVILGFIAVALVYTQSDFIYCGGGVVLLASIIIVMIYAVVPNRNSVKHIECS